MWTYEHAIETSASPTAIFDLFRDVATWPEWNAGVERIELHGPFASGTSGRMFMPGQDAVDFRLSWVEEDRGFEDETPLPDAGVVVRVKHSLELLSSGGTRIRYAATIDGPAADEVSPNMGPAITGDFPDVMKALAARAESMAARR